MTDPHYIGTILYVGLAIFAALLAAGLLMQERRWSVQRTALLWGAEGLILLLDLYLCFGLLPAPLRLPVSLTVGFLSYSAVFIAVSADGFWKKVYLLITFFCVCCISWSGGLYLCYFLLPDRPMAVKYLVRTALHIVTALPILLAYRKYGRPLLREVSGFRKQSWKLLSAVSAIYFFLFIALMSRIRLDDGVEPDTLFAFCAAVCTYASVSVLSIGNIFYMRRDAREALVKQKLEYLASYMETVSRAERESRRIRHDKRHHDACIAAMARAGDTDGILYGRMIEIYLYCSVSPIPFATMTNREWGQIGNNYLKGLFALGFQGFLIMICVGIYAVLVNEMVVADNLHSAIFSLAAYTVILCFSLFKSGALAKSIFNAH